MNMLERGNTQFAIDLYKQVKNTGGNKDNIFFSPFSISTAMAMAYAGARGRTRKEIAKVLHFNMSDEDLHERFAHLQQDLITDSKSKGYELLIANALWKQTGFNFLKDFIEICEKYGATSSIVDFINERKKSIQIIMFFHSFLLLK